MKKTFKINTKLLLLCTLSVAILSGCGKAKKEEIASELGENTDNVAAEIPERLNYTVTGNDGLTNIVVDAEVCADGYEHAAIYNAKAWNINEDFIKKMAGAFFDGGDYSYIKPYRQCTFEELQQEKQFYDDFNGEHDGPTSYIVYSYETMLDEIISDYDAQNITPVDYEGVFYNEENWTGNNAFSPDSVRVMDGCYTISAGGYSRLRGSYEGHLYEMYYEKYYLEFAPPEDLGYEVLMTVDNSERFIFKRLDTPYNVKDTYSMDNKPEENVCDYDFAVCCAHDVMDRLGLSDWSLVEAKQLWVNSFVDGSVGRNGYTFFYILKPDDINVMFLGKETTTMGTGTSHDDEWLYETTQPCIQVDVVDDGLYAVHIRGGLDVEAEKQTELNLLSFEKADAIMRDRLSWYQANYTIDKVEFGYVCISYDGDNFSFVPVWAYFAKGDFNEPIQMVNAVDGNIIYLLGNNFVYGYTPLFLDYWFNN